MKSMSYHYSSCWNNAILACFHATETVYRPDPNSKQYKLEMAGVSGSHSLERVNCFRMTNNVRRRTCMRLSRSGNSQDPFDFPEKKLLLAFLLARKSEKEREQLRTIEEKEKRHNLDTKGCLWLVLVRNSNYRTTGLEPIIVHLQ